MYHVPEKEVAEFFLAALQRDPRISQATVLVVRGFFDGKISLSTLNEEQRAAVHRKAVVFQVKRVSNAR